MWAPARRSPDTADLSDAGELQPTRQASGVMQDSASGRARCLRIGLRIARRSAVAAPVPILAATSNFLIPLPLSLRSDPFSWGALQRPGTPELTPGAPREFCKITRADAFHAALSVSTATLPIGV
jgi:hypothetical protein